MGNIFEDNTGNPFNDPEFRKQFLKEKGLLKEDKKDETEGYEILPPSDPVGKEPGKVINPVDIINNASRIPSNVGNVIHDLSGGRGTTSMTQKSSEIKSALNKIMTDYNAKYGLNVHLNLDKTADMLAELSDPTTFRSFELMVSSMFSRFRALLYFRLMQSMYLLIDEILSPKNLLGDSLELADKWVVLEKVSQLFMTIESFKDSVNIEGADTEMQKIGTDLSVESSDTGDIRDSQMVKEFMTKMLNNNGIGNNEKKN